jgi:fumarate reductase subunit C
MHNDGTICVVWFQILLSAGFRVLGSNPEQINQFTLVNSDLANAN